MPSAKKTPNIGLNDWTGNEYVKRQDFCDDNNKIDTEIGNLKKTIENIDMSASKVAYNDTTTQIGATNVQQAIEWIVREIKGQEQRLSQANNNLGREIGNPY